MKLWRILTLTLFAPTVFGQTMTRQDIVQFLQEQSLPGGELEKKVESFKDITKLPKQSAFTLWNENLLFNTSQQRYHECATGSCVLYERDWFSQLAELRFEQRSGSSHSVFAWPLKISTCIYRKWQSDEFENKIQLLKEEIQLHDLSFL